MLRRIDNLDKNLLQEIINKILDHKKVEKIVVFGSRAQNSCTSASDIDIAIFSDEWTDSDINIVKDRLENEIKTPLKFDLLDFYKLSKETLKENILSEGVVIYDHRKD